MKCALCCNKTQMYTKLNLANSYKRKVALDRHPSEWFWNLSIHNHWLSVHSERCIVEFSCIYCMLSLIICSYSENKIYHKNWDLFPKRSCISAYIDPKNSDLESSTNSVLTEMKNLKLHTHTRICRTRQWPKILSHLQTQKQVSGLCSVDTFKISSHGDQCATCQRQISEFNETRHIKRERHRHWPCVLLLHHLIV